MGNTEKFRRKEPLKLPRPNAALAAEPKKPQGITETASGGVVVRGGAAVLAHAFGKGMVGGRSE